MEKTDSSRVTSLFWTAVVLIAAFTFVSPFVRMGDVALGHLSGLQDDFFYYLTIARNLAETGSSTFDFIGHTNGYHPLWMGILTALVALVDADSVWFVVLLQAIVFVLILVTCHLFLRLAARALPGARGAHRIGALFLILLYANLARTGMEVIVVVPAMLGTTLAVLRTIEAPSNSRVLGVSVLCSLTVLARVDAAIFVFALVCTAALFLETSQRRSLLRFLSRPRVLSLSLLGAIPLLGYLALNYTTFGTLMPQSGGVRADTPRGLCDGRSCGARGLSPATRLGATGRVGE